QGGDEVLLCLNASDGKEVWKDKYEAEEVKGPPAGFKGGESFKGPRSSPAVANGKVCSLGVGGVVSCLDAASGKVAWRKDTKAKPQFYAACSPLMVDGLCIVYVGSGGRGELTAFELATGEAKWKWSGDGPSYGSPVLMTAEGVKQVVVLSEKNLVGVGLADGKLLWQIALSVGKYPTATPVIDGATVICAGTAVTVVKEGDKFTTKPAWKGQAPHQYNTPVLKDGLLYGLTGMGKTTNIYCQDAKTGEVLWTDKAQQGECGSVLDAGSVLLALSSTSELIAFKPSKDGFEQLAKYKVADTPTWAEPIIDGNRVFVKDRESLALWTIE
ncbi:MAG TPA: PQQ-binding-like beta-propeller repeat protein, partial [Gemmataceae bacterium]|nr:PQQ-binding-like beta-propeller repeat protein [Gemmataceae bacterium]